MIQPPSEHPTCLSVVDAVMLIVGIVIGAGIFALPSLVAANTGSMSMFVLAWVAGGVVSFAGALCYAELATSYPHSGGEHHFLRRAFGRPVGFLFAWSRLAILQTGSIAIQAYIVGDYLARLSPGLEQSSEMLAALTVVLITAVNVAGMRQGKRTQFVLALLTALGVLLVAVIGLSGGQASAASEVAATSASTSSPVPAFGLAMVFVLLAFGGWNEAAYVSADVTRRNMVRSLLWGIATVTVIYLLVNLAYVRGLGMQGLAASSTPAADLVERIVGPDFARIVSAIIAIAALSTMNATTITGGRSHLALGRDVPLFQALGKADASGTTPRTALLVQGAIALALVLVGALTRDGFVALIEYTAPVFWLFFFLVGTSVFILRGKDPHHVRPFRVPLYPLTPLIFCAMCAYMIRSSVAHTGMGSVVGLGVLLIGLPILWLSRLHEPENPLLKEKQIVP